MDWRFYFGYGELPCVTIIAALLAFAPESMLNSAYVLLPAILLSLPAASLGTFQQMWVSKQEYCDEGSSALERRSM